MKKTRIGLPAGFGSCCRRGPLGYELSGGVHLYFIVEWMSGGTESWDYDGTERKSNGSTVDISVNWGVREFIGARER